MKVRYTHLATTAAEQIETLQQRGLKIRDVEKALRALDSISYFRLAGYWRSYEKDYDTHQFENGAALEDAIDLYNFDNELRTLLFTAIQTIEVTVRTKMIKHFSHDFGPFWFMEADKAMSGSHFATNLAIIRKDVARSHDDFIKEHFQKYSEPDLPPVWKTFEVVTLGTLSKLFNNFSSPSAKHAVAREFGLPHHKFLKSWLECLAILRNCTAHHSRLVNRIFPINPIIPQRLQNMWITDFSYRQRSLYPQLCYVVYCLDAVAPNNTFVRDFKRLLKAHPAANPRMMGFPEGWSKEPLWKRKPITANKTNVRTL